MLLAGILGIAFWLLVLLTAARLAKRIPALPPVSGASVHVSHGTILWRDRRFSWHRDIRAMKYLAWRLVPLLAVVAAASCAKKNTALQPIFISGRAVAVVGDSIIAVTISDPPGVVVRNRLSGSLDTLGSTFLNSPIHVQFMGERWYVSDVAEGRPSVVIMSANGDLEGQIDLRGVAPTAHQFAVIPDGRIIVEGGGGELVAVADDSAATFAVTEEEISRTGLLVAASGGLIHAIPNRHITLYNGLGKIRWRVEWPWRETAYVSDIAIDASGRPHFIAGVQSTNEFLVYSFSPISGEIVRWSPRGPYATFTVRRLGELEPDSASRWLGE